MPFSSISCYFSNTNCVPGEVLDIDWHWIVNVSTSFTVYHFLGMFLESGEE